MPTAWVNAQDTVCVPGAPSPCHMPYLQLQTTHFHLLGLLLTSFPCKFCPLNGTLPHAGQCGCFCTRHHRGPLARLPPPLAALPQHAGKVHPHCPALRRFSHCSCCAGTSDYTGTRFSLLLLVDTWAEPGGGTRNRGCHQLLRVSWRTVLTGLIFSPL